MTSYRKILLCYDGSREGRKALRQGANLALDLNAETHVLAVVDMRSSIAQSAGLLTDMACGRFEDAARDILQERVDFAPLVETPHGKTKAEIRMMYLWTDKLRAVTTIIRMGRGKMMGVDHNRDLEWVGASSAFLH